ncbi:hypothetical protein HCU40_16610 [Pseudanabaena biceps]|nr:hypothetical protein [Pseudanabaena biceps]
MYAIEKQITRFEQPSVWVRYNKYTYDKATAKQELHFLRRSHRDISFKMVKVE